MNAVERSPEQIQDALQQLKDLQALDGEILQLRQQLGVLLPKLPALEKKLEQERKAVEQAESTGTDHHRERQRLEKEIREIEADIDRHKKRQMEVKTNKEYAAVNHEIDLLRKKIDGLETRVLEIIEEEETKGRRKGSAHERYDRFAAIAKEERERIEEQIRTKKQKLETRAEARERMRAQIAPDVLRLYDRLAGRYPGNVVVPAVKSHCGGCHMVLVSQKMVEIRQMLHFVRCEGCLRLFSGEEKGE